MSRFASYYTQPTDLSFESLNEDFKVNFLKEDFISLENVFVAMSSLENIATDMKSSLTRGGLSVNDRAKASISVENIVAEFEMKLAQSNRQMVPGDNQRNTSISMEGVVDAIKEFWKKIKDFFIGLWNKIKGWFTGNEKKVSDVEKKTDTLLADTQAMLKKHANNDKALREAVDKAFKDAGIGDKKPATESVDVSLEVIEYGVVWIRSNLGGAKGDHSHVHKNFEEALESLSYIFDKFDSVSKQIDKSEKTLVDLFNKRHTLTLRDALAGVKGNLSFFEQYAKNMEMKVEKEDSEKVVYSHTSKHGDFTIYNVVSKDGFKGGVFDIVINNPDQEKYIGVKLCDLGDMEIAFKKYKSTLRELRQSLVVAKKALAERHRFIDTLISEGEKETDVERQHVLKVLARAFKNEINIGIGLSNVMSKVALEHGSVLTKAGNQMLKFYQANVKQAA